MIQKRSISIIIPNYNGKDLLAAYLKHTIAAAENAGVEYEIIITDDCSKDDSVDFIRNNYPDIVLIVNSHNRGFSYSCNQGLKRAKYELILLLNSDVKLTPGYFERQFRYFELSDTFGVMGRIMNVRKNKIEDAARFLNFRGCKLKASKFYYPNDPSGFTPTAYLSGANALIDAKKLREIGGFDEIFSPFYSEDFDLSIRAWRLGWKCYYEHESVCYHQVKASTSRYKTKDWVKYVYYRNKLMVHAIHLNGPLLALWYIQLLGMEFLPKLLMGNTWIIKSYIEFFRQSREIKESKERLARLMDDHHSNLSIKDIMKIMRSQLENQSLTWL